MINFSAPILTRMNKGLIGIAGILLLTACAISKPLDTLNYSSRQGERIDAVIALDTAELGVDPPKEDLDTLMIPAGRPHPQVSFAPSVLNDFQRAYSDRFSKVIQVRGLAGARAADADLLFRVSLIARREGHRRNKMYLFVTVIEPEFNKPLYKYMYPSNYYLLGEKAVKRATLSLLTTHVGQRGPGDIFQDAKAYVAAKRLVAAHEKKGDAAAAQGQALAAMAHYHKALRARTIPPTLMTIKRSALYKYGELMVKQKALPPVSDEAERHMVRGQTFFKKDHRGPALTEMMYAIEAAPWWANAYHNLAVVAEANKNYKLAAELLKFYSATFPDAEDADAMRRKSYEFEAQAE